MIFWEVKKLVSLKNVMVIAWCIVIHWYVQLGWRCDLVDSLPMKIMLGRNQIAHTYILIYSSVQQPHPKNNAFCQCSVTYLNSVECQKKYSMGQPKHAHKVSNCVFNGYFFLLARSSSDMKYAIDSRWFRTCD